MADGRLYNTATGRIFVLIQVETLKILVDETRAVDPDPHSFYLYLLDPDPGGKNFSRKKQKKCKEIAINCKFIQFVKVNLHKKLLLTFEQSFVFYNCFLCGCQVFLRPLGI